MPVRPSRSSSDVNRAPLASTPRRPLRVAAIAAKGTAVKRGRPKRIIHLLKPAKVSVKLPKSPSPPPPWAAEKVFLHAKTVAWEGWASPLQATALFPNTSVFISAVLSSSKRSPADWSSAIHPIDKNRVKRHFDSVTPGTVPEDIDYRLVDKSGAVIWIRHSVVQCATEKKRTFIRGFVTDVQAEKEFQLESLRVSEREQNRIGQDLHDDLCQVLAGVSCLMRVVEGRLVTKAPEEVSSFTEINQQIVEAMHRTRALTHGLFPGKIQIADIRGALLELASQIRARFKVAINTEFCGRFPRHSRAQIIQIYRLAQEAMSNSIKHGHATQIDVQLEASSDTMALTVRDNGSGIDPSAALDGGVGLHIMRYRTQTLGGEFFIQNGSTGGVVVLLRYPFET